MPPRTSAGPTKAASDPGVETANKLSAILNELKRGNLTQESGMKKMMDTLKKEIVSTGLAPVLKVLDSVNKLVALMIMPFTNLLLPLVLPLLYFLTPIVRFLNISLRPAFMQLMDWVKSQKGNITAAVDQMKGGDIAGGITSMVGIMSDGITKVVQVITPYLDAFLKAIDFDGLIKMAQGKLNEIITGVSDMMASAGAGITDWLTKNGPTFQKAIGDAISTIGTLIIGFIGPIVSPFISYIQSGISGILSGSGPLWGMKNQVTSTGITVNDFIGTLPGELRTFYQSHWQPAVDTMSTTLKGVGTDIRAGLETIATEVSAAITKINVQIGFGNTRVNNDFISRPGQSPQPFSSQDTIVGFKGAPPNFGGNQNITIRLVDSMNNTISTQRLQAGSGANMTFTV